MKLAPKADERNFRNERVRPSHVSKSFPCDGRQNDWASFTLWIAGLRADEVHPHILHPTSVIEAGLSPFCRRKRRSKTINVHGHLPALSAPIAVRSAFRPLIIPFQPFRARGGIRAYSHTFGFRYTQSGRSECKMLPPHVACAEECDAFFVFRFAESLWLEKKCL